MTITAPNAGIDDAAQWPHSTFQVSVRDPYTTYRDIVLASLIDEEHGTVAHPKVDPVAQVALNNIGDGSNGEPTPVYFSRRKCRDTSLGGNEAINTYYQYHELDDVRHPFTYADDRGTVGLGRTFSENIDDNQQVMYITFGVPAFTDGVGFYKTAVSSRLSKLMNQGITALDPNDIGYLIGATMTTLIKMPVMPLIFLSSILDRFGKAPITKYYDIQNEMMLYYRMVNTILVNLSVNMQMLNDENALAANATTYTDVKKDQSGQEAAMASDGTDSADGLPDVFKNYSIDIFKILGKKYLYQTGTLAPSALKSTDQRINEISTEYTTVGGKNQPEMMEVPTDDDYVNENGTTKDSAKLPVWTRRALGIFKSSLYDADMYIGFRVEKGTDSSESVSNQTGESDIAQQINSKVQQARTFKFDTFAGNIAQGVIPDALKSAWHAVSGLATGVLDKLDLGGLPALASGAGMIDVPEMWQGSSFSKSYNFNMQLRAAFGDPVSILLSEYVPLACILAGSLPRCVGANSYTTPFVCRAYCKGMFAVPLGMIDSVSIRRGGDTHGWSINRLPTAIDVSFSIKDLSPAMYMGIGDNAGLYNIVAGANSSFQEYLMTLSGMGLADRLLGYRNAKRKAEIWIKSLFATKLNPYYWAADAAQTYPMRLISAVIPASKLPNN